jgi:nucleoside-diphosphate-sugar epimerase
MKTIKIEKNYLNIMANVDTDRKVLDWAITHCQHIIYPSSCAVYPIQYQTKPNIGLCEKLIDFESGCIGVSDHLYGWSKLTAERMLWQIQKETDIRVHVLRPFSGYGPGQSVDYPMTNLIKCIKETPDQLCVWGDGTQTRDWVHVDDIIATINWCVNHDSKFQTLNIGTGVSTSFRLLIQQIYRMVHKAECPGIKTLLDKPIGVAHRVADINLQKQLGIVPRIDLQQGIRTLL